MPWYDLIWNDGPGGNVEHIAEHGLTPEDVDKVMPHEVRQRILRPATPQEQQRHAVIRQQVKQELPELQQWARQAAVRHEGRVAVGNVFTPAEANVVAAIDSYAAKHALTNRSAVIREALSQLLGIEIARQ
jgi:predicted transcriptional regulator